MSAPVAAETGFSARWGGSRRLLSLMAIGVITGFMSGLLGVGGGIVMVPLLVLWLGYGERIATGTSLATIVVTGAVGALTQHGYGNVDVHKALLVGIPAIFGVVAGTWIQQRIPTRWIGLLFSGVLAVIAIKLIVAP
jgi:uncharacterized membrane protein YfcA